MKLRGFEKITSFKEVEFPMPERKTKMAAGYDICLPLPLRRIRCKWWQPA